MSTSSIPSSAMIQLRAATMEDAEILFELRNDPDTRNASHNTEAVSRDEHLRWLKNAVDNPDIQLYIAESDRIPVGSVRADLRDGVHVLSWSVSAKARRQGIGRRMVMELAGRIDGPVKAEIKQENIGSIRIAESAGLTYEREIDGIVHYTRGRIGRDTDPAEP